jgi:PadR family transcriptional regulator PadR
MRERHQLPRMSEAKARVLGIMLQQPTSEYWGYKLMKDAEVSSGALYPILDQLERVGWIKGEWEDPSQISSRPPRRCYRLTGEGRAEAPLAILRYRKRKEGVRSPLPRPVGEF